MILHTHQPPQDISPSISAHSYNRSRPLRLLWSLLLIIFSASMITLAAAAKLETPFRSDQSLLLYARMLSQGFKLYIDIWDIKQPAIYWFYLVSAEIFSYSEKGVHLGELIWTAACCVCLMLTLRHYFTHWALVPLSPRGLRRQLFYTCRSN